MPNNTNIEEVDLLRFLDSPGMQRMLGKTTSSLHTGQEFDDQRTYPQERVDAVTLACVQALRR